MANQFRNLPVILLALLAWTQPIAAKPQSEKKKSPRPSPTPSPSLAPGELPLAAKGATVIDALTAIPIYSKNPDERLYPASATKILTALLIIEEGNLDTEVTVEPDDTKVEPSSLGLKPGEKYPRRELLYGLMLKSANDVAMALARDNAGSVEAFGEKMTERARALGAVSSNFKNPHGLHEKEHYTTAHDLALITRAAMEQPLFRKIVATQTYPWNGNPAYPEISNHNKLLRNFPGCTGVKTGYTVAAQQVLVSAALRGGREVIAVVLHTNKPGIWEDSKLLLTHGLEHLPAYMTEL
jgi:D-alanyl-D-alanine carboxypeptidase (penicillin-binding protein 5/6)